jgi:hypothetical protein
VLEVGQPGADRGGDDRGGVTRRPGGRQDDGEDPGRGEQVRPAPPPFAAGSAANGAGGAEGRGEGGRGEDEEVHRAGGGPAVPAPGGWASVEPDRGPGDGPGAAADGQDGATGGGVDGDEVLGE